MPLQISSGHVVPTDHQDPCNYQPDSCSVTSVPSSSKNSLHGSFLLLQMLVFNVLVPMSFAYLLYTAMYPNIKEHDVFLSFRGEDTRNNFVSHLHSALLQNSIKPFIDDEFRRGETIAPALLKAIDVSKIAVIIFSKNYATSSWCLDELVKIVECHGHRKTVIPIFYNIRPSDVMDQSGVFAQAFKTHDENLEQADKVKMWRKAMNESANFAGWDSQNIKPEARLIKEVIKEISKQLKWMSAKYQTRRRCPPYFLLPLLIFVSMAATCHFSQQQQAEEHEHDVFVNCYGEITLFRKLVDALDKARIKSFNDHEHAGGEHMTKTIERAIEESKVAVIIMSAGYAYSARFLDELVKILDCHKSQGLELVPVCYHAKKPESVFAEARFMHMGRRRERKVPTWRKAVKEASSLIQQLHQQQKKKTDAAAVSGSGSGSGGLMRRRLNKDEFNIIPEIVAAVQEKLRNKKGTNLAGVHKNPVSCTYRSCLAAASFLVSLLVLILSNEMLIQSLVRGETIRETQCMPL